MFAVEFDRADDFGHAASGDTADVLVPLAHRTGDGCSMHHRPSRVCGEGRVGDLRRGHLRVLGVCVVGVLLRKYCRKLPATVSCRCPAGSRQQAAGGRRQ
eukprot:7383577-Prymnesium_polylepis.1